MRFGTLSNSRSLRPLVEASHAVGRTGKTAFVAPEKQLFDNGSAIGRASYAFVTLV
jgi:hypothetical protein